MRESRLMQELSHLRRRDTARPAISLEHESGDGRGMRSGRTGAGEVRLCIQVAHVIKSEEGSIGVVSRRNAGLETHFRAVEAVAHLIEVNRRRTGRGKVFRNAHPEDTVGRGAVATIRHRVALGVRRVDGEVFRRSDAGEAVAANDPADVTSLVGCGRHTGASDHILDLSLHRPSAWSRRIQTGRWSRSCSS